MGPGGAVPGRAVGRTPRREDRGTPVRCAGPMARSTSGFSRGQHRAVRGRRFQVPQSGYVDESGLGPTLRQGRDGGETGRERERSARSGGEASGELRE